MDYQVITRCWPINQLAEKGKKGRPDAESDLPLGFILPSLSFILWQDLFGKPAVANLLISGKALVRQRQKAPRPI